MYVSERVCVSIFQSSQPVYEVQAISRFSMVRRCRSRGKGKAAPWRRDRLAKPRHTHISLVSNFLILALPSFPPTQTWHKHRRNTMPSPLHATLRLSHERYREPQTEPQCSQAPVIGRLSQDAGRTVSVPHAVDRAGCSHRQHTTPSRQPSSAVPLSLHPHNQQGAANMRPTPRASVHVLNGILRKAIV